jgi:hypothetical protein
MDNNNKLTYINFLKGLEQLGLEIDDLNENWIYAGGFSKSITTPEQETMDNALRLKWKITMPKENIPDDEPQDNCICGTEILYNQILINKKLYDEKNEIEYIIIGSHCQLNFCENGLKVYKTCEAKGCFERHRNRITNYCNIHRKDKLRLCYVCERKISIGTKRIDGLYCSYFCKNNFSNEMTKYYIPKDIRKDLEYCFKKLKINFNKIKKKTDTDYANYEFNFKDHFRLLDYFNEKHKFYNIGYKYFYEDYKNKILKRINIKYDIK